MIDKTDLELWEAGSNVWILVQRSLNDKFRENTTKRILSSLSPLADKKVLDVGCGEGTLSRLLCQKGAIVTGIDFSSKMIEAARSKAKACNLEIEYCVSDAANMNCVKSESQDIIIFHFSLHDISDFASAIKEAYRVSRHGGTLFAYLYYHGAIKGQNHILEGVENWQRIRTLEQSFIETKRYTLNGETTTVSTRFYCRPLCSYLKVFCEVGFYVCTLSQWKKNGLQHHFSAIAKNNQEVVVDFQFLKTGVPHISGDH